VRAWIPPLPLVFGIVCFGLSWPLLFAIARSGTFGVSLLALSWVHLVALGWITSIALAILLHALPAFLDVRWKTATVCRALLPLFLLAVFVLVAGFASADLRLVEYGAVITACTVLAYLSFTFEPLARGIRRGGATALVARAFAVPFLCLAATAALGGILANALTGRLPPHVLLRLPGLHALLGIGGWLTLLLLGVWARTLVPIADPSRRCRPLHVASATLLLTGILCAVVGAAVASAAIVRVSLGIVLTGLLFFAIDVAYVVVHATVRHRPPQVLMATSAVCAVATGIFAFVGGWFSPAYSAAVYIALTGLAGCAVIAHMHHIGVRVLLTFVLGDDDDTRPDCVLDGRLSWVTVGAYQAAVLLGAVGVACANGALLEAASATGFAAFLCIVANAVVAYRSARTRRRISRSAKDVCLN
jgi:hypothetical protein